MGKWRSMLDALGRHLWVWMGVAALLIGWIPAITIHTIPKWSYWLVALICMFVGFCQTWGDEYDRAQLLTRELDEIFADMVLDWLQQNHPMLFTAQHLADKMTLSLDRVIRGLKLIEKEYKGVVEDRGASGWFYNPMAAINLLCTTRRLIYPKV